jgi:hypothetical protein
MAFVTVCCRLHCRNDRKRTGGSRANRSSCSRISKGSVCRVLRIVSRVPSAGDINAAYFEVYGQFETGLEFRNLTVERGASHGPAGGGRAKGRRLADHLREAVLWRDRTVVFLALVITEAPIALSGGHLFSSASDVGCPQSIEGAAGNGVIAVSTRHAAPPITR